MMPDWNPELYLKFKNERTQPSLDLVSRIGLAGPESILDIGCGPGNSTQVLAGRWPEAEVTGLDSSAAMIEKARTEYPGQRWILADAAAFEPGRRWGIVFSNAAIQWIPDHERLIPRFFSLVEKNGVLAVQVPRFDAMPLSRAIRETAESPRFKDRTRGCGGLFTYHNAGFYYRLLAPLSQKIELWETSYFHVLDSRPALIDFMRSTGMKPYLERLSSEDERKRFEAEVLERSAEAYPVQADGKVLFPFRRLFFTAYT